MGSSDELIVVGVYGEKLGHVDGKGKGLYVLKFDHDQQAFAPSDGLFGEPQLGAIVRNPTFLTVDRINGGAPIIYIVDERNDSAGSVVAATLDEVTGELKALGPNIPAVIDAKGKQGAACCHISVSPAGGHILAANYLGGSVVAIGRKPDGSLDPSRVQYLLLPPSGVEISYPGANTGRQEGSHAHMCLFSSGSNGLSLLVPDLGSDVVWSIPFDPTSADSPLGTPVATAAGNESLRGGGPRHVALHPSSPIAYVVYELSSQAAAFAIDPATGAIEGPPLCICNVMSGAVAPFLGSASGTGNETYSTLVTEGGVCSDTATSIAAARVTPSASHLVVSNRIVNATGALSGIPLKRNGHFGNSIGITTTLGRTPRDFAFLTAPAPPAAGAKRGPSSVLALAANQDTDEIALMTEGEEPLVLTTAVPTPVCLCMVPRGGAKGGAPVSGRDYLAAQGIEKKITDAVAVVLKERPEDAAKRIAELLLEK